MNKYITRNNSISQWMIVNSERSDQIKTSPWSTNNLRGSGIEYRLVHKSSVQRNKSLIPD